MIPLNWLLIVSGVLFAISVAGMFINRKNLILLLMCVELLLLAVNFNFVAFSRYLYYDGELSILIYAVPKGRPIPAHDHGIWETLSVYRGRIDHIVYARTDDGSVPGVAKLRVEEEAVLGPGDFAIVTPPSDIHSFTALDDDTYGITVVNGAYKAERHYYDPVAGTYEVRAGRNRR